MKLTDGELVKWQDGDAWSVGCVMLIDGSHVVDADKGVFFAGRTNQRCLVKHWPTGELEFVRWDQLESREVRND